MKHHVGPLETKCDSGIYLYLVGFPHCGIHNPLKQTNDHFNQKNIVIAIVIVTISVAEYTSYQEEECRESFVKDCFITFAKALTKVSL